MLEMSEKDIKNGQLISQEAMDRRNLEWLNTVVGREQQTVCGCFRILGEEK